MSALQHCAPRHARCASVGEVAAAVEAVFEGAWMAGGGVNEAMGESRAESLVGDAGKAVMGVTGESGVAVREPGAAGGGVAHRGRLLNLDLDAPAGGFFDGLLGLGVEVIVLQTATGRPKESGVGAGARATHPSDRRTWPRSTRRTMEGSIA